LSIWERGRELHKVISRTLAALAFREKEVRTHCVYDKEGFEGRCLAK
jgi:hypothetical protein